MKVVALISGGKDSCFNMMHCVANGHTIVALANLHPPSTSNVDELDSYMFQTVGHDVISNYSECMDIPLFRQDLAHRSVDINATYTLNDNDEVEDLFQLLLKVIKQVPDVEAVSSGAILSNYQRTRIENVCSRLKLQSLAYMWQGSQKQLLMDMIDSGVEAVLVKVAAAGLSENHLGKSLAQMYPVLMKLNERYGINVCGEGGEYETLTLDCPLFKKKLLIQESTIHVHSFDDVAPVAYLKTPSIVVKLKEDCESSWIHKMKNVMCDRYETLNSDMSSAITNACSSQHLAFESLPLSKIEPIDANGPTLTQAHRLPTVYFRHPFYAQSGVMVCSFDTHPVLELTLEEETTQVCEYMLASLSKYGLSAHHITQIHVNVADMDTFSELNKVYQKYFGHTNPPTRVTVETLLDRGRVQMDCYAMADTAQLAPRETLHVQSRSYWAPANIGPYSQAIDICDHVYLAGQIGLIPHTMQLPTIDGVQGWVAQASMSLKNLAAVCQAVGATLVESCVACICYIIDARFVNAARVAWEFMCKNERDDSTHYPPLVIVVVQRLPRNAVVEWEAIAGHPGRFDRLMQASLDSDVLTYGYIDNTQRDTFKTFKAEYDGVDCVSNIKTFGQCVAVVSQAKCTGGSTLEYNKVVALANGLVQSLHTSLLSLKLNNDASSWTFVYAIRVFHLSRIPAVWVESAIHAAISSRVNASSQTLVYPAVTLVAVQDISENSIFSSVAYASFFKAVLPVTV
ncbi:hypothetical protein O5D80_001032 [Batrachochytrium dendrobatidis]|nr:hypothetical protein O5D80_001032 [Batrachochytrium dendrobatidis]